MSLPPAVLAASAGCSSAECMSQCCAQPVCWLYKNYLDIEYSGEEYYPVRPPGLEFLLCHLLLCNLGWVFQLPFLEPHSLLFTVIMNCVYFIKHTEVLSETRYVINNKEKLTFYIDFISGHLHEFLFCFQTSNSFSQRDSC